MSSEIIKFIKNVPAPSLRNYFESVHSDLTKDVKWDSDEKTIKKSLIEISEQLTGENLALLNSDAERINALTDELGQSIIKQFVEKEEISEYFKLTNEYDRVLWLFMKDSKRFLQVEHYWYADTRRQSRMWDGFVGPAGIKIRRDKEHILSFKNKLMDFFRAEGNIKVEIYERTRSNHDDEVEILQIMVYREDLPNTLLTFKNEDLVSTTIRPVRQIAISYEPENGYIEVIAEGKENRESIVKYFSETLLESPISGDRIPLKQYDIQSLLKDRVLSYNPSDGIESVRVTMLKVARPNSNNSVTLDVATKEDRNIYEVSKEYFGDNDPLKSGFRLKQVRISIKFMSDHESPRGRTLHVKIREPHGCDLKSKSQKEQMVGGKYLELWGLVRTIQ